MSRAHSTRSAGQPAFPGLQPDSEVCRLLIGITSARNCSSPSARPSTTCDGGARTVGNSDRRPLPRARRACDRCRAGGRERPAPISTRRVPQAAGRGGSCKPHADRRQRRLRARFGMNSKNSSKPPSSDGYVKRHRSHVVAGRGRRSASSLVLRARTSRRSSNPTRLSTMPRITVRRVVMTWVTHRSPARSVVRCSIFHRSS